MVLKYLRKIFGPRMRPEEAELPPLPPLPAEADKPLPEVAHRPIPKSQIDPDVVKILHRLTRFGHTAYIVGGGVRDLLLHRTPKDFDVGTSALPRDIKKLFRNCRIIGRRFRLAHIFFREKIIEVATFRANVSGDETAGEGDLLIRSDNIFGNPETDALRRDFTINALFYDVDAGNVIDYVGGLSDLDAGLLRTIGDPDIRLREDPIRILRAVRLAGRLDFEIDEATLRAIRTHRDEINKAAVPRILEDLLRMLRGSGAERAFRLMQETGVLEIVLPELQVALRRTPGRRAGSGDREEVFWKALHAIDLATNRGTEFSNPTLLAPLVFPRLNDALTAPSGDSRPGRDLAKEIDGALSPVEKRLNIPRRDRDRLRQVLLAQRRFTAARKGRRFSTSGFISRPFFPEAFDLFEIICSATGQHRDELRRWRERIAAFAAERGGLPRKREAEGQRRGRGRGRHGEKRRDASRGRDRRPSRRRVPAGSASRQLFADEEPERPELSEEDIALVYGTVLEPEIGATLVPSPGRSAPPGQKARRRGRSAGGGGKAGRKGEAPKDATRSPAGESADEPAGGEPRRRRRRRRGGRKHRRTGTSAAGDAPQTPVEDPDTGSSEDS
jgi:poly(A) polymerase